MKSLFSPGRRPAGAIEPLESRIAPARIIQIGAADALGKHDINYDTPATASDPVTFVNTETGATNGDAISLAVGGGAVGVKDTFYIRLTSGDDLKVFSGEGFTSLLTVTGGNVVAFFVDKNLNNEAEQNELVSISAGKDAAFILRGGLDGDIVTNLDEHGTKDTADDTLDMTGLVSAKQGLKSVKVGAGSVPGKIISGGNILSVEVEGGVGSILAGGAANGATFDFFPGVVGGNGTLSVPVAAGQIGSSISKVTVDTVLDRIEAGTGGAGANGGALSSITVTKGTNAFLLKSGDGGDAGSGKTKGGNGGAVSNIYISGINPTGSSANDLVQIVGGHGGGAPNGVAGAGGSISSVFIGYQLVGNKPLISRDLSVDNYEVHAGAGGDGKTAGAGGSVSKIDVVTVTPNGLGEEVSIIAGNGGNSLILTGGKTGAGGSLIDIKVRNSGATDGPGPKQGLGSGILLEAGDAGNATGASIGSNGGSITNATLLGSEVKVFAGNGAAGKIGGAGGSLKSIIVDQAESILAQNAIFNAGFGGEGSAGNGGAGGNISGVRIENGDFNLIQFNAGASANGGAGRGGKGGIGGSITNVDVFESDAEQSHDGVLFARTGQGGDGLKGGGNAGSLTSSRFVVLNMDADVRTGGGGSVTGSGAAGNGGSGGAMTSTEVVASGVHLGREAGGVIVTGNGGSGLGKAGSGGAGGDVRSVNSRFDGSGSITAGAGGSGDGGAAGKGASITVSGVFAEHGSAALIAGNAGAGGAKAGNGGSIVGLSTDQLTGIYAQKSLDVRAGAGTHGGAGGNIRYVGYGSSFATLTPSPSGNINIIAGDGSVQAKTAGVGGFIDNVTGAVSSGSNTLTLIHAGAGAGNADKSSAGGNVSNITITRGGQIGNVLVTNSFLVIEAGDAGDGGANVKAGAKGGDVRSVAVTDIGGVIFRSLAAGDGGDSSAKGGLGGSVDNVRVFGHTLGVKTGQVYGYSTMGGVFAGAGGAGGTAKGQGPGDAGNVSNLSADSVSAIVAGKLAAPKLVQKVSNITLNGLQSLKTQSPLDNTASFHLEIHQPLGSVESVHGVQPSVPVADVSEIQSFKPQFSIGNYVLSYHGESTSPIPAGANATTVQNALNSLESITLAGGVTVKADANGNFIVTFNDAGNRTPIGVSSQLDFNSTETVAGSAVQAETQTLQPAGATGTFTLTLDGDTTTAIAAGASGTAVADALNALASVQSHGGVSVVKNGNGSYSVSFNDVGDVNPMTGVSTLDAVAANEPVQGRAHQEIQNFEVIASTPFTLTFEGETTAQIDPAATAADIELALNGLTKIAARGGVTVDDDGFGGFNVTFNDEGDRQPITYYSTTANYAAAEVQAGDGSTKEIQDLSLAGGSGKFTLSFNGQTTSELAIGATAAQINTALNALSTITNVGGVVVSDDGGGGFLITFNQNGNQPGITGEAHESAVFDEITVGHAEVVEVQHVSPGVAAGTFTLSFGGKTTAALPVGATAAQVETALNALPGIAIAGGVTVATDATGYVVNFINAGDRVAITGSGPGGAFTAAELTHGETAHEVQNIHAEFATGSFTLSFGGQTTSSLPYNATADDVENALNALATVNAAGSVSVTPDTLGGFNIHFLGDGDVNAITGQSAPDPFFTTEKVAGTPSVKEVQSFDASFPSGTFTLNYGGATTAPIAFNANALTIQNALNLLSTIQAGGGVTVAANGTGGFDITFNNNGNRAAIFGQVSPAGFTAAEVTPGELAVNEVQTFTQIGGTLGTFKLTFAGSTTDELSVAGTTPQDIEDALNALPSIIAVGGVSVAAAAGGFAVTFNAPGDQPQITAEGTIITPAFAGTATLQQIEDALNSYTAIDNKIAGDGVADGVDVVRTSDHTLVFKFRANGDQGSITAQQEFAVNDTETYSGQQTLVIDETVPGTLAINEVQSFKPLTEGFYFLSFGGVSTFPIAFNATALQVEGALNAVSTIANAGGVTVTANGTGGFDITFNTAAPQTAITGVALVQETQNVDVAGIGEFELTFNGLATNKLPVNAPASLVQSELNAIGANVTVKTGINSSYDIRFNFVGDQPAIGGTEYMNFLNSTLTAGNATTAAVLAVNFTKVHSDNLTTYHLALENAETVKGASSKNEVQSLSRLTSGTYTLGFAQNVTAPLAFNATAATIQAALNALPTVSAAGGVTVKDNVAGGFDVTFVKTGDQPAIAGISTSTLFSLPGDATGEQLQAALNALPLFNDGIANNGTLEGVSVVRQADNSFVITYRDSGNKVAITGVEHLPDTVVETTTGGFTQAFTTTEVIAGQTGPEIQNLHPQFSNGTFTLTFNGQTTNALAANASAGAIQGELNSLPSIASIGGVTVTDDSVGGFNITFANAGDRPAITGQSAPGAFTSTEATAGNANVTEVQTLSGITPSGTFTLTFGADTTSAIAFNATAAQVQTALNALASINTAGGVTVTPNPGGGYAVHFTATGDQAAITAQASPTGFALAEVAQGNSSVPAIEIQHFATQFTTGTYTLSFQGEATAQISVDATAADVEAELNSLASINGIGGVTVAQSATGGFDISFVNAGNQEAIVVQSIPATFAGLETVHGSATGVEVQTVKTGTSDGSFTLAFGAATTKSIAVGATADIVEAALNALPTVVTAGGVSVTPAAGGGYTVTFKTSGDQPAILGQATPADYDASEVQQGSGQTQEEQSFTLPFNNGTFVLNYKGDSTTTLPANASTTDVENALNALPSVIAAGGVTVSLGANGEFVIDFVNYGNRDAITGVAQQNLFNVTSLDGVAPVQEVQHFTPEFATGTYKLNFGADTTGALAANADAAAVSAALNALPSIVSAGGVYVTGDSAAGFDVTFKTSADVAAINSQPTPAGFTASESIHGDATTNEQQQFNGGFADGTFKLTFNGQTTLAIPFDATGTDVAVALNSLSTIQAQGGVTVSFSAGVYTVNFNDPNDQPAITGQHTPDAFASAEVTKGVAPVKEQQNFKPPFTDGEFVLSFGNETTGHLAVNTTAAAIQTELNALVSIQAEGGVTVSGDATAGFTVTFNQPGDKAAIIGQSLRLEVQTVDVTNIGNFTLTFGGDTTTPLVPNATAAQVEAALNLLPAVISAGGVTVSGGAHGVFSITFKTTGDKTSIGSDETLPLTYQTTTNGSGGVNEVQQLNFIDRPLFTVNAFTAANIVAAIADYNELGSNRFKFLDANQNGIFDLGEIPIDGLIAAKVFDQNSANFTPQAKLVGGVFYDFDNQI